MFVVERTARVADAFYDLIQSTADTSPSRDVRYQPISHKEIMQDPLKKQNEQPLIRLRTVPHSVIWIIKRNISNDIFARLKL